MTSPHPTQPTTSDSGPSLAPPTVPPGWIAQWDANSSRYYYVMISTGATQWEVPTVAAAGHTPMTSPAPGPGGYLPPGQNDGAGQEDGPTGERGSLGSMAMQMALGGGKKNKHSNQSGLMGMASSVLGGSSSGKHSNSSNQGGLMGMASSMLNSGKPSGSESHGSSNAGLGGLVGGALGALTGNKKEDKHSQQQNQYGQGGGHGGSNSTYYDSSSPGQQGQQSQQGGLGGMFNNIMGGSGSHGQVCFVLSSFRNRILTV